MRFLVSLRDPWVIGQLLLFVIVGLGTWFADRWIEGPAAPGSRPVALALVTAALMLGVAAGSGLGRSLTPTVVPVDDGELVTQGLYAWVRHPIYLAVILLLTGMALTVGRWWSGVMVAVVAYGYFDRKAALEERLLVARYPEYAEYRQRVGKLLPWVGRGSA